MQYQWYRVNKNRWELWSVPSERRGFRWSDAFPTVTLQNAVSVGKGFRFKTRTQTWTPCHTKNLEEAKAVAIAHIRLDMT